MSGRAAEGGVITVRGARANNLRNVDVDIPLARMTAVTGVSGSGKSSLAFDTVYAEGQRRYVETFSAYTRQFLDRMDRPAVDAVEGVPPAIAIDQTNPVRTSRSTVGTMTEINDYLKLLYARAAGLTCRRCRRPVQVETPQTIGAELLRAAPDGQLALITFEAAVPANFTPAEVRALLAAKGYHRIHAERRATPSRPRRLEVVQDRVALTAGNLPRIVEDLEAALRHGGGRVAVRAASPGGSAGRPRRFSAALHCAACDLAYREPLPSLFSFNSPIGACERCRGFGRIITIDYDLVIPDRRRSLADGAVRPWQTDTYRECQIDLIDFAQRRGIPIDVPWQELPAADRRAVIDGEGKGAYAEGRWYGVRGFFDWLEGRAYRMHLRVMLSRYRAYVECPDCRGTRLKPEALWWRLGARAGGCDGGCDGGHAGDRAGAGLHVHDVALLPIEECAGFFDELTVPAAVAAGVEPVLADVRTRLRYLTEVGLGYLTLDRQSRTLSGGEVQRINLTTALGTQLVNALFVLDEPSIGLHHRDVGRLIGVLHRLRDAGNTLLVVEHDPAVIRAADHVVDLGPGPGRRGGRIEFAGPVAGLARSDALTGRYLSGRLQVAGPDRRRPVGRGRLGVRGARANNLKRIDVDVPLGALVCLAGVSGSGKSTLLTDVLFPAVRRAKGLPAAAPGAHRAVLGCDRLAAIELIDQSPIGKSARSTPVSYVKALGPIRKLFAATDAARGRGLAAGAFSFNTGDGRCRTCGGAGFEHVEMQFLSDVYLRCADCDGRRFRPEVEEVRVRGRSIADVLDLTVDQAVDAFPEADVQAALRPLAAVGLGYLTLGQAVPTLSGGEAQRLKIAGHLAGVAAPGARSGARTEPGVLFLMDEPTTGLHFADIAVLIDTLRRLAAAGHSLIVVEHNLDVLAAADHLIELGPEGGAAGGRVVAAGAPEQIARAGGTPTALALRDHGRVSAPAGAAGATQAPAAETSATHAPATSDVPAVAPRGDGAIRVRGAREHNLRGIDLAIPRDRFTVVTGVSGSGKSTLAFDVLFAEGQRRYLESLNAYVRQFVQPASRPDVDGLSGMPPAVAIEQRTSRGGRKSTVATLTEIYHFLRLLYVRLGVQHCPDCGAAIEPQSAGAIGAAILERFAGRRALVLAPLVSGRKGYYTDLAAWAAGKGFAELMVDGRLLATGRWPQLDRYREHDIEAPIAAIDVDRRAAGAVEAAVAQALEFGRGALHVREASGGKRAGAAQVYSTRRACPSCRRSFAELDPRLFSFNSKHGWCPVCYGAGLQLPGFDAEHTGEEEWWTESWEGPAVPCSGCAGRRLRPEALAVTVGGRSIDDLGGLAVQALPAALRALPFDDRERTIARDVIRELRARLGFLKQVGLGYLGLDRAAPTLSGGEAQRIRLAAQLGSQLRGVCYVLDEPSIGMHARDNHLLLATLRRLQQQGNTVVVVEHDEETIRSADHVVDLGPGGGAAGGHVVAHGSLAEVMAAGASTTGRMLRAPGRRPVIARRRVAGAGWLTVREAALHNLRGMDVRIPLAAVTCVTGVSGSGKSTLARRLLFDQVRARLAARAASRARRAPRAAWIGCRSIEGWQALRRALQVDQTPIGRTPRSCPATYVGVWDEVRALFAAATEARIRGYGAGRFSFNVDDGRCAECAGQGVKKLEMSFLPDVAIRCEACGGARFDQETLAVRVHDRSVADVLALDAAAAAEVFAAHPRIAPTLRLLVEVGLGYLTLGQPSPTLSGGEAQRIKLVAELAKRAPGGAARSGAGTLYVLDEPTIGLHMADVDRLTRVLHRLADCGDTVVVIEHNLDVIAEADHVIDLGPDAGDAGGRVVAQGPPQRVAAVRRGSRTAPVLARFLRERAA